jgi:hypothetical protein
MKYMHRGWPCSKKKLVSTVVDICCLPNFSRISYFSYGKPPTTTGLTCDDMHKIYRLNDLIQDLKLIHLI